MDSEMRKSHAINHTNGVEKLNVHYYDNGGLKEALLLLEENIKKVSIMSIEEKNIFFSSLIDIINKKIPEEIQADHFNNLWKKKILINLSLIINEFNNLGRITSSSNYDPTNDIFACDLLLISYSILISKEDESVLKNFLEQIEDISTGPCAQGRCCRLIQFVIAFL